jgi:mannosylglycerate hydrolase
MTKTCIVVSHTHWDREWYETFQQFRLRLVRLMDKLLRILDMDPTYRYFMLDGQTIILDDYLQVRPEREADLRRQVQLGRLLIGPWYLLPDEFLVSGEALVRNLLLGERTARRFGAKMGVGYTPDPFGHISQLPQVLRGFGMDSTATRRGLDDQPTELLWQSADGSTVLLCYLRDGYDNAARLPVTDAEAFVAEVRRLHDSLAPYATTDYVLLMNGVDHMEPVPELPRAIASAAVLAPELSVVHGTLPMYLDAVRQNLSLDMDNLPLGPQKLQTVRGELRSPKRHHLLPGVLSTRMWIKQRNTHIQTVLERWAEPFSALAAIACPAKNAGWSTDGETLAVAGGNGGPSLTSSSALVWQAWKYLLENHPHDSICGCGIDQVHREMATRFDWAEQIAEEVTRQSLTTIAAQVDTASVELPQLSIPLIVFNPLVGRRTDLVTTSVQVPGSLEEFVVVDEQGQVIPHGVDGRQSADFASLELGREEILGLPAMVQMIATLGLSLQEIHVSGRGEYATVSVTLMEGGRTDAELIASAQRQVEALLAAGLQRFHVRAHRATTVTFHFVAQDVPGCGYRTYFLTDKEHVVATPVATPGPETTKVVTTKRRDEEPVVATSVAAFRTETTRAATTDGHMENEFLSVDISLEDGTLVILDKSTGVRFSGLHRFVDGGDRGDEYDYCAPEADQLVSAPAMPPKIVSMENGPARCMVQVEQVLRVPAGLGADRSGRSQEMVEMPIASRISLYPRVPRLDFRTEVDNRARDHRLRVHFPSPMHTNWSEAEGTFDVLRRPLGVPTGTSEWVEQPVPTHPQKTFVNVSDGAAGLMVVNRGLPEYEALGEPDGSVTVALTLLRCVGWLSRDDYPCRKGHAGPALETPEAQCLGHHVFEYAIVPHAGNWRVVYPEAHAFSAALRAVSSDLHAGCLPLVQSLISLQGEGIVLSAVKEAEKGDGWIVRCYNTLDTAVVAQLRTFIPPRLACLVNLAEEELRELPLDGPALPRTQDGVPALQRTQDGVPGLLRLALGSKQVVTVKLRF